MVSLPVKIRLICKKQYLNAVEDSFYTASATVAGVFFPGFVWSAYVGKRREGGEQCGWKGI